MINLVCVSGKFISDDYWNGKKYLYYNFQLYDKWIIPIKVFINLKEAISNLVNKEVVIYGMLCKFHHYDKENEVMKYELGLLAQQIEEKYDI